MPPPQRVIGNSKEGVLKAKIFKGKYEPKLEFPGEWVIQAIKKNPVGGVWIFSGTTHIPYLHCKSYSAHCLAKDMITVWGKSRF